MAWEIFRTGNDVSSNVSLVEDYHITVDIFFKNGDNTPVDVDNPTIKLYDANDAEVETRILKSPYKANTDVGRYSCSLLLLGALTPGAFYTFKAVGLYGINPITVTTKPIVFKEKDRIQWYIETLRSRLSDEDSWEVPRKFYFYKSGTKYWSDGELYTCLLHAIEDLNETPPTTPGTYTFDTYLPTSTIVRGAMIYALMQKGILESINWFDVSLDAKVNIDRSGKFKDLANLLQTTYIEGLKRWKLMHTLKNLRIHGIAMLRVPRMILRPVSDEYGLHLWNSSGGT